MLVETLFGTEIGMYVGTQGGHRKSTGVVRWSLFTLSSEKKKKLN